MGLKNLNSIAFRHKKLWPCRKIFKILLLIIRYKNKVKKHLPVHIEDLEQYFQIPK